MRLSLTCIFDGDLAALPAEVVKQFDHAILSRGEAAASLSDFGAQRECGLCRGGQAAYRNLVEADRHGRNSVARCTEGWRGCANTPPFSSGKRVFLAEEILHRSPDSVLRVGSEFQAAGLIEAVYGLNQADRTCAGQIVECDARRYHTARRVVKVLCRLRSVIEPAFHMIGMMALHGLTMLVIILCHSRDGG